MEIEPVFEISDAGVARPVWNQPRDGRRYLSADEAAAITGEPVDRLMGAFRTTFDFAMFGEYIRPAADDASTLPPPDAGPGRTVAVDDERLSAKRRRMIRDLREVFPRLDDDDLVETCRRARRRGLDPWRGHVWADRLPRDDGGDGDELVIGLTAEGFREVAREHPAFDGFDEMEYFYDVAPNCPKVLTKCRSTAYRVCPDGRRVKVVTALTMSVADQGTRLWREKPDLMLYVATRNANIRETFGGATSGLYSREELSRRRDRRDDGRPAERPRKAKWAGPSAAEGITSPGQLRRVLITEFGVKGKDGVERAYAALRAKYAHLSDEDPAFYDAALAEVREHPDLYGATVPPAATPTSLD
jgi:hypothetical protein